MHVYIYVYVQIFMFSPKNKNQHQEAFILFVEGSLQSYPLTFQWVRGLMQTSRYTLRIHTFHNKNGES